MNKNKVQEYAKKTFFAMDNRYSSVKKVYPNSIDAITETSGYYMGTKEVALITPELVQSLEEIGYAHHTIDKASHSGRAIDLDLINPLTGKFMTGSSSGTALNVFLGINDLGVGTDGGGSVLAPAMSLNLFGFIHPDLGQPDNRISDLKISTDGLSFTPSIGLITKDLMHIEKVVNRLFNLNSEGDKPHIKIGLEKEIEGKKLLCNDKNYLINEIDLKKKYEKTREELIQDLTELLENFDIVVSKEGPVDLNGFGDSVFGHFSTETKKIQNNANKGCVRVANMVKAISIVVPTKELASGYCLMTKNKKENILPLLKMAKVLSENSDELSNRYFGNLGKYFEMGL